MKMLKRWAIIPFLPVLLILAGCELITPEQAQETLDATREIRRVQEEQIRPRLDDLYSLEAEIEPLERELHDLEGQMRSIYMDQIRPLEDQLREYGPDDQTIRAIEQEFEERMFAIRDEERLIDEEMRLLERQWRERENALRDEIEATAEDQFRAFHDEWGLAMRELEQRR